jgi:hypothetical protein
VVYGSLLIGDETEPYAGDASIILHGRRDDPEITTADGIDLGSKVLAVLGGSVKMYGTPKLSWTRLAQPAAINSAQITLRDAIDWKVGDQIFIATTDYEPENSELLTIARIDASKKVISLDGPLEFAHFAGAFTVNKTTVTFAAEVGVLTRNVAIVGADDDGDDFRDMFGCRVVVADAQGSSTPTSAAKLDNVEFRFCGQRGFVDIGVDARPALLFQDLKRAGGLSAIRNCAFNRNFNGAAWLANTDFVTLTDNSAYITYGASFAVESGSRNQVRRNVAVQSLLSDIKDPLLLFTAGFRFVFQASLSFLIFVFSFFLFPFVESFELI